MNTIFSNNESEILTISVEEEGERLDKILTHRFTDIRSRTYVQWLILNGYVLLNGRPVKKMHRPKAGDVVEIEFVLTPELDLTPENIPLDILYEDDYLLAVNKPAGMVVHPAPGNWSGTFVNALLYHCHSLQQEGSLRPGIIHRLDKDTTGVLLAAKDAVTQQKLSELFSQRQIYKEYLAICYGNPGTGEVSASIGRHPIHRKQMCVLDEGGREAVTRYETMAYDGKLSVVAVQLLTGRTHQIRVHMKHLGAPILGDAVYGNIQQNKKYQAERQMLHARQLKLTHPITGQPLDLRAEIPADMRHYVQLLRLLIQ